MNNLSPEASQIESIQASLEYQSAQAAVQSLRDLKSSMVEVCDVVFDNSLSTQEQLALIDSSLDRALLNSYIESYVDVAQKVLDYIYILEDTIDQNPDAQRLVEFLRAEIADLNNELVDFDSVDQYPELRVFIDLNSVLVIAIQKPWMVLNKEYRARYFEAMETYVSEFSRIRRERLAQAVEFQKVQELLHEVYIGVNRTDYRLRTGMWIEGSRGDLTEEMFLDSDLAETLNVVLREYLQRGYEVTPIVNRIGGYNGKDSRVPFSMYDIAFEISNGVETQVVRPVDVEQFYHPLLHGRIGFENKQPLEQMYNGDFKMQTVLQEAPVWDGNLDFNISISIDLSSLSKEMRKNVKLAGGFLGELIGMTNNGHLECVFSGEEAGPESIDIDAVKEAISKLRESGDSTLEDFALKMNSYMDKYDDYKVVFDLITKLKYDESIDTGSKVEQVIAKAREVESSLVGSQVEVSGDLDEVRDEFEGEDYEQEGQEDYNDESDLDLEDDESEFEVDQKELFELTSVAGQLLKRQYQEPESDSDLDE